jgi:hypothetical protein
LPRRAHRSRLIAVAALIVVGIFTLAANAAAGIEAKPSTSIPDSAFRPVSLPPPTADLLSTAHEVGKPPILREPFDLAPPLAARAQPSLEAPKPIVVHVLPKTTHVIRGYASYYCRAGSSPCTNEYPDDGGVDRYAAAGPRLRAAIGPDWRDRIVYVDGIRVRLIDWCQCYKGESNEKLLDLYYDVFDRTGSPVTIRW